MAETTEPGMETDEDAIRQRLLRRIGLAGVLIVALVASLAIFDAVFVHPPEPEEAEPAPVAVSPAASAEPAAEKPAEAAPEPTPAPAAAEPPAEATKPAAAPPPETAPSKAETPAPAAKPESRKTETKPITRPESKVESKGKNIAAVPEETGAPTLPPPPAPPAAAPATPAAAKPAPVHPLAANQPLAPTRTPAAGQGYLVQMGVFSNVANAEELKTRLDKAGIPAHIEARVQVGPFKNKAEAEAAQKKLAEMGLSGLLLSPRK